MNSRHLPLFVGTGREGHGKPSYPLASDTSFSAGLSVDLGGHRERFGAVKEDTEDRVYSPKQQQTSDASLHMSASVSATVETETLAPQTVSAPYYPDATTETAKNSSSTTNVVVTQETNYAFVGFMVGIMFILAALLIILLAPILKRYIRRKISDRPQRIQRRYETIEGWLISKRVRIHNDWCAKIRTEYSSGRSCTCSAIKSKLTCSNIPFDSGMRDVTNVTMPDLEPATSYDTVDTAESMECFVEDDDTDKECPICMEGFRAGEIVSWSPNILPKQLHCNHVFHHECIKEWLLRHGNCPFCRQVFLPVDAQDHVKKAIQSSDLIEYSRLRAARSAQTYYCVADGLVTLSNTCACCRPSTEDVAHMKWLTSTGLTQQDLKARRGGRAVYSTAADNASAPNDSGTHDEGAIRETTSHDSTTATPSLPTAPPSEMVLPRRRISHDAQSSTNDRLPTMLRVPVSTIDNHRSIFRTTRRPTNSGNDDSGNASSVLEMGRIINSSVSTSSDNSDNEYGDDVREAVVVVERLMETKQCAADNVGPTRLVMTSATEDGDIETGLAPSY